MRRMFSEKQLASIVAEVLKKYGIEYSTEDLGVYFPDGLIVESFGMIYNIEGDSLGDLLYGALSNPTDLSDIEDTFAENPTGHQIPNANKSSLTEQEVLSIKYNMIHWIQKGYIKNQGTLVKISAYRVNDNIVNFIASSISLNDTGELDTSYTYRVNLNIEAGGYTITIGEI